MKWSEIFFKSLGFIIGVMFAVMLGSIVIILSGHADKLNDIVLYVTMMTILVVGVFGMIEIMVVTIKEVFSKEGKK